jgi:Ca2+:H+ antiporter
MAKNNKSELRSIVRNPLYWLLIFIPITVYLELANVGPVAFKFASAAFSIVPLAALLAQSTEQISYRTGSTLGAFVNATFGNAPELIISFTALRHGLIELVKATIIGSLLANLLFVQGISFLVGGLRHHVQEYNARGARMQSSMLMIAVISMILPSIFHNFITPQTERLEQDLNGAIAVVLLIVYFMSLFFMLRTHPDDFAVQSKAEEEELEGSTRWKVKTAILLLLVSSVALAVLSEILVGSVEETVATLGMSRVFIGVVLLALVSATPEAIAGIEMARRNKIDLTVGISVGSSLQMILFVAPLLVLCSYFAAPRHLNLVMGNAGAIVIFLSVLIMGMIAGDGRSNWFKGLQLLVVFLLFALLCYFLPNSVSPKAIK